MENLALRQQVIVFKRQHRRPSLTVSERLFFVLLHRNQESGSHTLGGLIDSEPS
jgi:hypothetical protein